MNSLIVVLALSSASAAPGGKEIMTKNEEARRVQDLASDAVLATGGGGSEEKTKKFTWWRKLQADGTRFNTLTRFHAPAEIRGEGILFLEKQGGENEVLLYLPNFKKIRRVESQAQSGSFMGSEFSYSDIATPHVDDYGYKVLKEEACPAQFDPSLAKVRCHVVESKPANEAVKDRAGYARSVTWVRQDNWMGARAEYFDSDDKLWKTLQAADTKLIDPAKGKWLAHRVRMESARTGKYTVLQFSGVKANQGVEDSVFTQQNLSRAK